MSKMICYEVVESCLVGETDQMIDRLVISLEITSSNELMVKSSDKLVLKVIDTGDNIINDVMNEILEFLLSSLFKLKEELPHD